MVGLGSRGQGPAKAAAGKARMSPLSNAQTASPLRESVRGANSSASCTWKTFFPSPSLIPLPLTLCLECWLIGGRARDISVGSIHSNCPSLCRHKQRNKERTILSVGTISPSINEQLPVTHGTNSSTTFTTCADWTNKQAMDRVPIFVFFVLFFLAKRLIARHRQLHRRVRFALD